MNTNWMVIPVLLLGTVAYWLGYRAMARVTGWGRLGLLLLALPLAVPGVFFTLYYAHLLPERQWFYTLRAVQGSELLAAPLGFLAGLLPWGVRRWRLFSVSTQAGVLGLLLLWLFIPFVKSVVTPSLRGQFLDRWQDGVCIQTLPASCGAASAATLARAVGVPLTEGQLGMAAHTSRTGTEAWYLARALRRHGIAARFRFTRSDPLDLPYPALAGTLLNGGAPHFVAVLGREGDTYLIGDPLTGPVRVRVGDRDTYRFTGFFLEVKR